MMVDKRIRLSDQQFGGDTETDGKLRRLVDDLRSTQAAINRLISTTGTIPAGITDHGALTGLGDDDHPQYLTSGRGDGRYYTQAEIDAMLVGLGGGSATVVGADEAYAYFVGGA